MPDDLDQIASAVAAIAGDMDARTMADALWLAAAASTPVPPTPQPADEPEHHHERYDLASRDMPDSTAHPAPRASEAAPAAAPLFERRDSGTPLRGTPVRVPLPPALPQAAAIARALRPFTRPWRQGTATQLDVDATVDRYVDATVGRNAKHRVLTPVLRTAPERWFDVVVVVDNAATMAVWHDTVTEFVRLLTRTGFFRAVHRWSLTDSTVQDHLSRSSPLADAAGMTRVPHARRLVLVVSDFASAAWRGPALWNLVTAWARATPTALIDPLPVRFWAHSGMDLPPVRVTASGPPGPTSALRFRVPLRARLTGDSWLPVPALALTPTALDRWARTIIRTDPEGCDAVLVPAHRVAPPLASATPGPAAEAFLRTATAPAARLALLSAPFEHFSLPLLRLLHANAVPEAEPADLAELLISGLATIDDPSVANPVLTYHPAARDHLLDHVTTDDVWTAHQALTSFIAAHPNVTPSMLALAHTPGGQEELPAELRPFAAATTDTLRLLGVLPKKPPASPDALAANTQPNPVPPRPNFIPLAEAAAKVPPLPFGTRAFVGRDHELAQLKRAAVESNRVVIHGLDGAGKSTLAIEFAHRRTGSFSLAWWISASSTRAIDSGLAKLATILAPELTKLAAEQRIDLASTWLAENTGWLLILDNVTTPADTQSLLERVQTGTILITSRCRVGWRVATTLLVDVPSQADAIALLGKRIRYKWPDANLDAADRLCAELGWLPLAIQQAGDYMAQHQVTPTQYLDLLAQNPEQMLSAVDDRVRQSMARVWDASLDQLTETPLALDLLRELAWYAPDNIPRELIEGSKPALMTTRAIEQLAAQHMIIRNRTDISVNNLVQTVIRTPDPRSPHRQPDDIIRARNTAAETLANLFKGITPPVTMELHRYQNLLPHALTFLGRTAPNDDNAHHSTLALQLGLHHYDQGQRYDDQGELYDAIRLFQRSIASRERLFDPSHPDTLRAQNYLAAAYQTVGDHRRAIDLFETTLSGYQRIHGPDHPDTLFAQSRLAYAYHTVGDHHRAIDLFETTLSDYQRIHGPDHPDTLRTQIHLAISYQTVGEHHRAIAIFKNTLSDYQRIHGPDHPDTLSLKDSLMVSIRNLAGGNTATPIAAQLDELPPRIRVHALAKLLGSNSRELMAKLGELGETVRSAQSSVTRDVALKLAEALTDENETDTIEAPPTTVHVPVFAAPSSAFRSADPPLSLDRKARVDKDDAEHELTDTITARYNELSLRQEAGDRRGEGAAWDSLGLALQETRRYSEAIIAHRNALNIYKELDDHHSEAIASNNLGLASRNTGDFEQAKTAGEEALRLFSAAGDFRAEESVTEWLDNLP